MSMFLQGSSHCSCNLASECTHVCWLVWVGACAFFCVGWYVPPEVRIDCCALCVRVHVHVCARQRVLFKSHDMSRPFHAEPRGSKSARRYRQSPLEHALATVSRPSRPKVTTLPRKTAGVQKRAPLPPEPSRARACHGFAPLETKSDDPSAQNCESPKACAATARALYRARPCHGFAPRETKSDDPSAQNRGGPKACAATARALYRVRPCHGFAALETKSDDPSAQNRGGPKACAATARAL